MGIEAGLNTAKLKKAALDVWKTGGPNTLVKVAPKGTVAGDYPIGYCTTFKYVNGRTPAQLADVVGIAQRTKFLHGVEIFLVAPLPHEHEFSLRGYTQLPGGVATNDPAYKPHDVYPPGQGAPQWDVDKVKQRNNLVHLASVAEGERFVMNPGKLPAPVVKPAAA